MIARRLSRVAVAFAVAAAVLLSGLTGVARADGCYVCGTGSRPPCGDYCRYTGKDSSEARRACEKKGCRVSGTASCPAPGGGKRPAQICSPDDAPTAR